MPARFSRTRTSLVRDLADKSPVTVSPGEPATRVRRVFRETGARIVYVVEPRRGSLLGRITRGDILAISSAKSNALAQHLMEDPPVTLEPEDRVGDAITSMLSVDEWYAPVVKGGVLHGHLGLEHVAAAMLTEDPDYLRGRKVEEVMTRDVVTAHMDDFVVRIWERMRELRYAGLPVVDSKGKLVGIITQYDLLSEGVRIALESPGGPNRGPRVREVMTASVTYVYPWSSLYEVARLMVDRGYGRIPVVESETTRRLAGIVDREDIVRIML